MSRLSQLIAVGLLFGVVGCGDSNPKEQSIEVKQNSPVDQAKNLLEKYAKGQPLGSEVTSFEYIVKEVRKTDAARADTLEKGFAELQKLKGAALTAKAKELLKAISPQPGYPGS